MGTTQADRSVKTDKTAFAIIETIQNNDGARISEIASELGLAKSTVHRHVSTLVDIGYLKREGDEFHLGLRFLEMGEYVRTRKKAYDLAREKVEELAEETEERAQFVVEEHGRAVYVSRKLGSHAVRTDPGIGKRVHLHTTAAGKAILAHLSEEQVHEIVQETGLPAKTENTITSQEQLHEELAEIRDRGYSMNRQENIAGLRAIAVPVTELSDRIIGALCVSGPTERMKGTWFNDELPSLMLGIANELELNIAYA